MIVEQLVGQFVNMINLTKLGNDDDDTIPSLPEFPMPIPNPPKLV